ncbi:ABC transporter substrate-binding protein [Citricoccus sp. GCM10030269]|uniref:ABC transporter substrate-binding protein n=1 Tax=Citricoccus sp. GCM10030269 TaxID=3273388 RepID=UPI00360EC084
MSPQSSRTRPQVNRRGFLTGALGLTALGTTGLLTSCGTAATGGTGGSTGGGSAFTYLSYLPMETLSVAPELLADAGGHFENHGLQVTFQSTKGSPQAIQTLVAGAGPLTRVGAIDLLTAAADGQPLVNVGSIVRGSSIRILNSTKNPLEKPEDFLGKTIGVPSEGGTSDKSLSLMLHKAGLNPDDVARQVVGLGPGSFELVKRGDIAGYMVSIDQSIVTQQQFEGEAQAFDAGDAVRADSQIYTASKQSLEEHGDDIKAYLAAIHDAVQEIVDDESLESVIETMRTKYSFGSLDDDAVAKESLRQSRDLWTAKGTEPLLTTDEAYWSEGYAELVDAGMVDDGADPTEWMDNSYLPSA